LNRERVYEALVVAVLSVNNYPLEKAWEIRGALESASLFNPEALASLPDSDLVERLRAAGYDRGEFLTDLVASRLQSVGAFLVDYGVGRATQVLSSGTSEEVHAMLIGIKGVGPAVIRSFLLLRGHDEKPP
jgi:endonuclease III-like uncharacterized protein